MNTRRRLSAWMQSMLPMLGMLCVMLGAAYAEHAHAAAVLRMEPAQGSFSVGSTVDISFVLDTGGDAVNAVEAKISYPPDLLQVVNPSVDTSFIALWVTPPTHSNTEGTLIFRGGVPTPGIVTNGGSIATATFRVRAPGSADITYEASSRVLANDGQGTNVLSRRSGARLTLALHAAEGPELFSPTHPDSNTWYRQRDVTAFWNGPEGADAYSWVHSTDASEVPDEASEGSQTSLRLADVADGLSFIHLRARVRGAWGGTTHYALRIDGTPPAAFTVAPTPATASAPRMPVSVAFATTDAHAGIERYELRVLVLTASAMRDVVPAHDESSPYAFFPEEGGDYEVVVRAYDRAGNSRLASARILVGGGVGGTEVPIAEAVKSRVLSFLGVPAFWWLWWLLLVLVAIAAGRILRSAWRQHVATERTERNAVLAREQELMQAYQEIRQRVHAVYAAVPSPALPAPRVSEDTRTPPSMPPQHMPAVPGASPAAASDVH